jgi:hypothetical protein
MMRFTIQTIVISAQTCFMAAPILKDTTDLYYNLPLHSSIQNETQTPTRVTSLAPDERHPINDISQFIHHL